MVDQRRESAGDAVNLWAWWFDYWAGAMNAYAGRAPKIRTPAIREKVERLKLVK